MAFKWIEPEPVSISEEIREHFSYSILLAEMLSKRGFTTLEGASAFLDPAQYHSPSPFTFPDMEKAVFRLKSALEARETIGIWGDFDADGQTSTALLVAALREMGEEVAYRIPVRAQEKHGIQASFLEKFLQKKKINLLITCDTGISELEALELASKMKCDVILTDHHTPPDVLPPAHATINPRLLDNDNPFYHLAGVGTAYQLIRGLFEIQGEKDADQKLLDLVALGTIADIAELNPENRFLVQKGLSSLNTQPRPAIQALLELAGMKGQPIDESMIGFVIAPRLNAAGRLADANMVVEFLLSKDAGVIDKTVRELEDLNFKRKMNTDAVIDAALKMLQADRHLLDHPVIILARENWEKGVVGIAASHLVEEFQKPAILLSISNGIASGSARSVEGVNIIEAIRRNSCLLHTFGGHPMAAGLNLDAGDVDAFRHAISKTVSGMAAGLPSEKQLKIDAVLPLPGVSNDLAAEIRQLSPFGAGNPAPILLSRNLSIDKKTVIGKSKEHLKLSIRDSEGEKREAIWWRGAGKPMPKEYEDRFDLAYRIQPVSRNGQDIPQLEWLDFQLAAREIIEVERLHRHCEITDLRAIVRDGNHALPFMVEPDIQIWGEALQVPRQIPLVNRFQLRQGHALAVMTAPPSQPVLFEMINRVMPKKIIFMDLPGSKDTLSDFSKLLMGLVKYAINHKEGNLDILAIASVICHTEAAIRIGMDWLASMGKLNILDRQNMVLKLAFIDLPCSGDEPAVRKKLQKLLDETAAYRSYYRRCSPGQLLPPA